MKLLLCLKCSDVFSLNFKEKTCGCGETKGRYIDELNAEISGNCEPIGFANNSFIDALKMQRIENKHYDGNKDTCCKGIEFTAFIIPLWASSVKRVSAKTEA